ncbi:peptidylprolyl isomerase [Nitrincola sp. MINF-07-Sa-05]|uniref:peptidylprolyl isomerase n=1 Tax=Nitrincola salilacus TaxID=3400273 RepID=UPI00391847E6
MLKKIIPLTIVLMSSFSLSANDGVVLERNGVVVTEADIASYIEERVPADRKAELLARRGVVREMVENIYVIRQLAQEGSELDVLDEVQLQWQVDFHRDRLLMSAYLERYIEAGLQDVDWEITAREVYVADGDKFLSPESVTASHILIKTEGRTAEEAKALAESLRERAVAGEEFEALAVEFSEDPSAEQNKGNLGRFDKGRMVAPFEVAVFALREPGQISDVVETDFGFHVIKLHEYHPAKQQRFEDVRAQIEKELRVQIANKLRQDRIIEVRSAADIDVNTELLEQVEAEYRSEFVTEE